MAGYGKPVDKSWWFKVERLNLRFNPVVTLASVIIIWGFIIACVTLEQTQQEFPKWRAWVTEKWTWLYIGSQDAWSVFIIILYFSKYGTMKLGRDEDEPEYSTVSWFTMLFACGVAVGLMFFGVAEPMYHYLGPNRYTQDEFMPDNLVAQHAINLTYFHWGIHAWIVYSLVGALLGILAHREGLPMTTKSCFYPLIGDKIFGWIGDFIDTLSVITTLFGVCTSLGLGVIQINSGLNFIHHGIPINQVAQVCIIWTITAMATASTVSGIGMGIRRLSEICFSLGCIILLLALFMEDTWFLLNLYVQSIGFYLNWIVQLGFHCDAFELAGAASGAGDRGRATVTAGDGSQDGPQMWMDGWTIFYWGWWIAWCPFVGMFIGKISKGRTIREFVNGTISAPMIYSFLWMAVFGGSGIMMERHAAAENLCCNSDADLITIDPAVDYSTFDLNTLTPTNGAWCNSGTCNTCAVSILVRFANQGMTSAAFANNLMHTQNMEGGELGDFTQIEYFTKKAESGFYEGRKLVRLSCLTAASEQMWFYLMDGYYDIGGFMVVFSLIGLVLYFITSSDSGSLVIDCISANGDPEPPVPQRVFWALTEGAAATALLVAGGTESLTNLQTISIVAGLPYTFVICFMCIALWRACAVSAGDLDPNEGLWNESYFEFCTTTDLKVIGRFLKNLVVGPHISAKAAVICWGQKPWMVYLYCALAYGSLVLFVAFHLVEIGIEGAWAIGWLFYLVFVVVMTAFRVAVREQRAILGSAIEDFLAELFCYASCSNQIEMEMDQLQPTEKSLPA